MKTAKIDRPCPLEADEQAALMQWVDWATAQHPELALLHHIPNGGSRHRAEAANLRRQGVKAGVPDLCLPVPRGPHHGLYIELKRQHGNDLSQDQRAWLEALIAQGYVATMCRGAEAAQRAIEWYFTLPALPPEQRPDWRKNERRKDQ